MANNQVLFQNNSGSMIEFSLSQTGRVPFISYLKPGASDIKTLPSGNMEFKDFGAKAPFRYAMRPSPDMVDTIGTLTIYASGTGTTLNVLYVDIEGGEQDQSVPETGFTTGVQKLGYSIMSAPWSSGTFKSA
jgi:hypothetical protein